MRSDLLKADAGLVCESSNRTVVRWLTDWNFPGAAYPRVRREMTDEPDLLALAQRDKLVVELSGRRLTEEYVESTYNVDLSDEPAHPMPQQGGADGEEADEAEAEDKPQGTAPNSPS